MNDASQDYVIHTDFDGHHLPLTKPDGDPAILWHDNKRVYCSSCGVGVFTKVVVHSDEIYFCNNYDYCGTAILTACGHR